MAHEREIGGIRCFEVLEQLADYLDGDLTADDRARVDAHLAGCDWCERFGGSYAGTVKALRSRLLVVGPVPDDVEQRLFARLAREVESG